MKRVDFHLLPGTTYSDTVDYCARLCEKVVGLGQGLHLHVGNDFELAKLDEGLWTYKPSSFLPHAVLVSETRDTQSNSQVNASAITLANSPALLSKAHQAKVLVTLTLNDIDHLQGETFERLILLIPNDEQQIAAARGLYKRYKQGGSDVHLHDLRPKH